jgi:hypothetical protein
MLARDHKICHTPKMQPLDVLADTKRGDATSSTSAPDAVKWLQSPIAEKQERSWLDELLDDEELNHPGIKVRDVPKDCACDWCKENR